MATALLYDPLFLEHDTGAHPESVERLVATRQAIEASGLLAHLQLPSFGPASVDDLSSVHAPAYVEFVEQLARRGGGYLDPDTVVSPRSYAVAAMAAGATMAGVDAVLGEKVTGAFALVRPPGHHAMPNRGMGFCLFNNVAIATRHAQMRWGLQRVLIVDFDVHHGNGTQDVFRADSSVLYFSTHQYPFYPGTGYFNEVGNGAGYGATVNVPLPAGVGDHGYLSVFGDILEPLARRFQPELIMVSAGYDAHWLDPIGMMNISVAGFAAMSAKLLDLAGELCAGRLVFALEGGYSLQALSQSVVATLEVLAGLESADQIGQSQHATEPDISAIIDRVRQIHFL